MEQVFCLPITPYQQSENFFRIRLEQWFYRLNCLCNLAIGNRWIFYWASTSGSQLATVHTVWFRALNLQGVVKLLYTHVSTCLWVILYSHFDILVVALFSALLTTVSCEWKMYSFQGHRQVCKSGVAGMQEWSVRWRPCAKWHNFFTTKNYVAVKCFKLYIQVQTWSICRVTQ